LTSANIRRIFYPGLPEHLFSFHFNRQIKRTNAMRILFLTSAHNSLSQRLRIELGDRGHDIRVCVASAAEAMIDAVSHEAPDLILAPMLKIAIPEEVWSRHLCLIVHPGIKGDRGPSSLDWAITNNEKNWGVSILEAADEFDAGPIWASHEFAVEENPPAKSSLYRGQVTEAAVRGVLEAVARLESGEFRSGAWQPAKLTDVAPYVHGCLRSSMRQADRAIDWMRDTTAMIVRKIRAADSAPGVLGTLLGKNCFLYGAPHYRSMGNLYGSEYWTYTLPRLVGQKRALELTLSCKPIGTQASCEMGLLDDAFGEDAGAFVAELRERARHIARDPEFRLMLRRKHERRLDDEHVKPLASYCAEKLAQMWVNFFGPDPACHEARRRFVFKGNPPPQRSQLPFEAETEDWIFSQGTARPGMGVMSVF
jgi:methionyl-tRNA formyltransferase